MATKDAEAEAGIAPATISATSEQILANLILPSALGLGLICFVRRAQAPKPLSAAIGAAHGALKAAKAVEEFHFPSTHTFLLASKALIKGYKASKRLNLIKRAWARPPFVSKRLAAYSRALNVVRYARCLLSYDGGVVGLGFLSSGYKFSKSFLKVLEGFLGTRFDSAVRDGFDAVGLWIKAAIVVSEVERIATVGRRRNNCCRGFARRSYSRYVVHSSVERTAVFCGFADVKSFPVEYLPPFRGVLILEQSSVVALSELLCLSIPLSRQNILP
uniref:Putative aldo-keto reductase 2 n=1 Tax=Anthurium amnicola TaxID=1678845 RepID=A0A1D1ZKV2_9ARAE